MCAFDQCNDDVEPLSVFDKVDVVNSLIRELKIKLFLEISTSRIQGVLFYSSLIANMSNLTISYCLATPPH